jgi:hypothetical protein
MWEEWLEYFEQLDELSEDQGHYTVELKQAIKGERYNDAAKHKRKLQEISSADTVAAIEEQLQVRWPTSCACLAPTLRSAAWAPGEQLSRVMLARKVMELLSPSSTADAPGQRAVRRGGRAARPGPGRAGGLVGGQGRPQ